MLAGKISAGAMIIVETMLSLFGGNTLQEKLACLKLKKIESKINCFL